MPKRMIVRLLLLSIIKSGLPTSIVLSEYVVIGRYQASTIVVLLFVTTVAFTSSDHYFATAFSHLVGVYT